MKSKHSDSRVVGAGMRKARLSSGLTLSQVGEKLGVTKAYISDLERGNRKWSEGLLSKYKDALKS